MSPSEFLRAWGRPSDSLTRISRQFRKLESLGLIEELEQKSGGRRRGGVEHIYRSVITTEFDTPTWTSLPERFREMLSGLMSQSIGTRMVQAIEAGTMDARSDRHLTWMTVPLDQEGWDRVVERTDSHFEWVREETTKAAERLEESEEKPILTTIALAAFESPPESTRNDPNP